MKISQLLSLLLIVFISSCQNKTEKEIPASESFMPMQIGNRWEISPRTYTEVQDTLRIDNKLYYKFYSLIGGDATATKYLRIDEKNQLLEAFPDQPGKVYTHAQFDANVNDEFYTLGDKTENDYKVKLVDKTADKRTFEFESVYHPNLKGETFRMTYTKGIGLDEDLRKIRIDGKVIR